MISQIGLLCVLSPNVFAEREVAASTKRKPVLVNNNDCTGATQENRRYHRKILRLI